ncbi:MAG: molybdate ABC transporter substrate-binding protein [Planctomycetota bacterium]
MVFAAASATNALEQIKAAFCKSTRAEVRTSCAGSSTLAQQIVNGAEADIFISADVKWADHVEAKMPVVQRRDLLGNRLVIVVGSDSQLKVTKPEDLLSAEVKHLALADPDVVPAGKYAKQALTTLGLWDKVKARVASAEDVRHALTFVETGAAEAGIVYATDAAISKKAKAVVEIPADLMDPVRYPALLLKRAEGNKDAAAFYDYLGSPEAAAVFAKYGFTVLSDSGRGKK